jgi:serine/threonine-protein kinase
VAGELRGAVLDGRYRLLEPIATGAMGEVYKAERVKLGRPVAVKFLQAALADDATRRQRFEIEARAMARLDHPCCSSVIDVGLHAGMPYLVMDFVAGKNLREVLDRGPLEIPRAVAILRQVLWGLAHAHELGIIHRDIKPANVMLSDKAGIGEQVRLLDFGLAKLRENAAALTVGMVVGTPAYMAPEQCTGTGTIDARTDVYACGVLLFEMLTGRKPFEADGPVELLRLQMGAPSPRLDQLGPPGVSYGPLEEVVARALAKSPNDRFPSALAFAAALDAAVARPVAPAPAPPPEVLIPHFPPPRRLPDTRILAVAGGILAIFLIGILARLLS